MSGQNALGNKTQKVYFCTYAFWPGNRASSPLQWHCRALPIWAWHASLDGGAIFDGVRCGILHKERAGLAALAAECIAFIIICCEGDVAVDVFDDGLKQNDRHAALRSAAISPRCLFSRDPCFTSRNGAVAHIDH